MHMSIIRSLHKNWRLLISFDKRSEFNNLKGKQNTITQSNQCPPNQSDYSTGTEYNTTKSAQELSAKDADPLLLCVKSISKGVEKTPPKVESFSIYNTLIRG
jgi:hypothetical protein